MFTGLVEDCGLIKSLNQSGTGVRLTVESSLPTGELSIGDSVAVNGACLTVVEKDAKTFTVDMSPETFERTTFSKLTSGHRLNLERALRVGDRLGGHIVTGHIDCVGMVDSVRREQNAVVIMLTVPDDYARYLVAKGSVAIDGISLTINTVDNSSFSVSIIPHTLSATTLVDCQPGRLVNIETDILGKYIERLLGQGSGAGERSNLTSDFLAKHGFM
ncbi:MAG: riboflavin synthase [Desulfuromonas sp.]|nr:MAG: riboflavin synthase [Desulfuromonas sp.]